MADMKPWDIETVNGKKVSDDFLIPLWKDFRPQDFYFAIREGMEDYTSATVFITPSDYFIKFKHMYGDSMPIINLLPDYLEEVEPGRYEVGDVSPEALKYDLLFKGFILGSIFETFIKSAPYLTGNIDDF